MPSKKDKSPIVPGLTYHIYNRGQNSQKTFYRNDDYDYFLKLYKKFISCYVDTYAYSILPNHFHFLIRVKDETSVGAFSNQFRKFILSYTFRINFREKRSGSLFLNPFKRIEVKDEDYLKRLIFYIHYNPEKHEITENYRNYKYTSYKHSDPEVINLIAINDVYDIWGGKDNYLDYHNNRWDLVP